jgi:hypothetical protein
MSKNSLLDRVLSVVSDQEYFVVRTAEQQRLVAGFRYKCYLREDAISPNSNQILDDEYDQMPGVLTVGITQGGSLVASIRLHLLTATRPCSPTVSIFRDAVTPILGHGTTALDCTRFVVAEHLRSLDRVLAVLSVPFAAAHWLDVDFSLAPVKRSHMAFYSKYLAFERVCEPRVYPPLVKQLGLMIADYRRHRARVLSTYPFFGAESMALARLRADVVGLHPVG